MARRTDVTIWMPLYVRDILADTSGLNATQFGAYALLLCHMWLKRGYLDDDQEQLRKLARVSRRGWPAVWKRLVKYFTFTGDGRITQKRLLHEMEQAIQLRQARSEAGRKGAAAKHGQADETDDAAQDGNASQLPLALPHTSPSPSPSHEEIPPTPRKRGASARPWTEAFRTWIAAYPVQIDLDRAWRAWQEVEAELPPLAEMLATLSWQKRLEFDRRPPDRVPYPAKYLRSRRWTDKEPGTASAERSRPSTPSPPRDRICPFHCHAPEQRKSEADPSCPVCRKLGPRPRRRGSGEATPVADVIRERWPAKEKEVQR